MLRKIYYAKMLERNRMVATLHLLRGAKKASGAMPGMMAELRAAAAGAGYAVEGFANYLWPDRKAHPDEVRDFLKALTADPEGMVPAHRVATWALLEHRFAIGRPNELEELMQNAADCIGLENDPERWVAHFGPLREPRPGEGENRHATFLFGSFERMIEATIGRDIERDTLAGAVLEGSLFLSVGVGAQDHELEHNLLAGVT